MNTAKVAPRIHLRIIYLSPLICCEVPYSLMILTKTYNDFTSVANMIQCEVLRFSIYRTVSNIYLEVVNAC